MDTERLTLRRFTVDDTDNLAALDSDAFLGWASLRPHERHPGVATLGYHLRRAVWGRCYATEAARALISAAFRDPGLQRITATTYQDNHASRRVMEKAGMTLARTIRYTPERLVADSVSYVPGQALWDGNDVEYALERAD